MILKVFTSNDDPIQREAIEVSKAIEEEGYKVENYDLNNDDSFSFRDIYDIYRSPAMVITQEDGTLVEMWQGEVPSPSILKNFLRL